MMQNKSFRFFDIQPTKHFNNIKCRVHPAVVMMILDAYNRKEAENSRVIGTLLGRVTDGNVVDVTDCYPVIHRDSDSEGSTFFFNKDYHESMYKLKQRINKKDQVIGWFSAAAEMENSTCIVHNFYDTKESLFTPQPPLVKPIHLFVDPTFKNKRVDVKAFVWEKNMLSPDHLATFYEIPLQVQPFKEEKMTYTSLVNVCGGASSQSNSEGVTVLDNNLELAMMKLLTLLKSVDTYVQQVLDGERVGDREMGRELSYFLSSTSLLNLEEFDSLCQKALEDNLMVLYLSKITKMQAALAEKLSGAILQA